MHEYNRLEAAFYDSHSLGLEGDVAFYVEQAVQAGSPVLELGCGTGRITLPVAQAGIDIVGLDRSPDMLAIAQAKIDKLDNKAGGDVHLVKGDMRTMDLQQQFRLVMVPYRAFLHLLTPDDEQKALHAIYRHLVPGGRLILNIFDPDLALIAAHSGPLGSALKRLESEFVHPETGNRIIVYDTRCYEPQDQLVKEFFVFEEIDNEGRMIEKVYAPLTLRYLYRYEMQYLLERCGFTIESLWGDFQRGPFRYGGEQIWVARRPEIA